jgi:hypothetical protein
MQHGGIVLSHNVDARSAFMHFLSNSRINYLSEGSFGTAMVLNLTRNDIESEYMSIRAGPYGYDVRRILVKFVDVGPDSVAPGIDSRQAFVDEVNTQTDIYMKTVDYLQPLCPAVLYAGIFKNEEDVSSSTSNSSSSSTDERTIESSKWLWDIIENGPPSANSAGFNKMMAYKGLPEFGIIAMEFAGGFDTVHRCIHTNPEFKSNFNRVYIWQAIWMIIDLAVQTGYNHGDHHLGNILVDTKSHLYFKGVPNEWMLIDFGQTKMLQTSVIEKIRELYDSKKYLKIMEILYDTPRLDGLFMQKYPAVYGYAVGKYDVIRKRPMHGFIDRTTVDNYIHNVRIIRSAAIMDVIEQFKKDHADDPDDYPLLPISEPIRAQLYTGIIEHRGGRRRRIGIKIHRKTPTRRRKQNQKHSRRKQNQKHRRQKHSRQKHSRRKQNSRRKHSRQK